MCSRMIMFPFQISFFCWRECFNLCLCFCIPGQEDDACKVLVLSYPQYCRYRSVLARLREQPSSLLIDHTVLALGGIAALGGNTRILYCRDTFDHPALLQNESICDEFGEFSLEILDGSGFIASGRAVSNSWEFAFVPFKYCHQREKLELLWPNMWP